MAQSHKIPTVDSNNAWTGTNTYSQSPTVPEPSGSKDAVPKDYVDAHSGVVTVTPNQGVGANGAGTLVTVPETGYSTTGGVTSYACQEDHNKGVWDVRCHGWASNPSTALTNTIQLAMCYFFTTTGAQPPVVVLPSGSYSLGGNISLPPGIDIEGTGSTQFGTVTQLTTTDPTQPMMTQVASQVFNCSGTNHTASGVGATVGNLELIGNGPTNKNDVGLVNASSSDFIHNISFINFGGPGRTVSGTGINSRGAYISGIQNLQWYYLSGAYNTSGFTDTTVHGNLELFDADSYWDHIQEIGFLQDSGYYNRYYLAGLNAVGAQITHSFVQINPHNIWVGLASGSIVIAENRFDDGWWDSIHLENTNTTIHITDNWINGYCTSTTLNPSNFSSNPGGVTTDANCAAIESLNLGSYISGNTIAQTGAQWPFWAVYDVFMGGNVIAGLPSVISQPNSVLGGQIGNGGIPSGNPGADASGSVYNLTFPVTGHSGTSSLPLTNTSGLGGLYYAHLYLNDGSVTNYTSFTGGLPDSYITINIANANDTITPSAVITTCSGSPLTSGLHWFWNNGTHLYQVC